MLVEDLWERVHARLVLVHALLMLLQGLLWLEVVVRVWLRASSGRLRANPTTMVSHRRRRRMVSRRCIGGPLR